ncbi:uncharacterized protein LOC132740235 [Ruditapes philippinarum]|uniref:uncharacterized protein LOC132740235 n=1 Tax=Ruditapes philippinarum TaxID=129788 RepID=UPI00295B532B|nr:uncharacterized protein LOC132740235 [Ruditapes philippinarum]
MPGQQTLFNCGVKRKRDDQCDKVRDSDDNNDIDTISNAKNLKRECIPGNLNGKEHFREFYEATKDHLFATQARHSIQKNITVQKVVESLNEQDQEQDTDSITAQLNTMYYIAKQGVALNQFDKIIELQVKNNCPGLQNPKKIYTSEESKTELLDAINATLDENLTENLHKSDYIGLVQTLQCTKN